MSVFVVLAGGAAFGYYWWLFGTPTWFSNGPDTLYLHGNRYEMKGPFSRTDKPDWRCISDSEVPLTGLHYCRVDPPETAMVMLTWYDGQVYTLNIQDPVGDF
ncbi:hypothetical protein FOH10_15195 [Nocardia otitidiscaviarum]|uniref:Uncharacterized protein n=1 Tax=Nocardia otitidiscaviarum TaxID=1823 RepID=A0A516NLR8_9NOCA|nr:hypothetical protein [Nocardia otitidiscaviarum]MCP9625133.1 hypothetical protein [Nocardia otitidiscaviarum]QDP79854.1 hypothetical protein FOH10_15195 [Nocardia otitidiscaviarum]